MLGSTFGLLTVVGKDPYVDTLWLCKCACGFECLRTLDVLQSDPEIDCGRPVLHDTRGTHKREFTAWNNMLQRCTNPEHEKYHRYGGRGIKVCPPWHKFRNFIKDMGACPASYSIERRNNDGNYEPNNCVWIPTKNQWRNKSKNKWVQWQGERMLFTDAARAAGVPAGTVRARIARLGWTIEQALSTPIKTDFRHRSKIIRSLENPQ